MTALTFDSLKLVDTLEKVEIPREQARAIVNVVRESRDATLAEQNKIAQEASVRATSELDTKTERAMVKLETKLDHAVSKLDTKIDSTAAKLESDIALVRKDVEVLRWMMTIVLGGVVTLLVRSFLSV